MLPDFRLDGRHALITGGGRGLGRASAVALAEAGAIVTVISRTAEELASVVAEIEVGGGTAFARRADVTDSEALEEALAAAETEAPLDILVTAAGLNRIGPTVEYALDDLDALIDVNVRATFVACRAVGRQMLERGGGGRIITISSQMGTVGYPGRAAYCATKHAVNGLTKALAVEWAPQGITVNSVAPTFVRTPLTAPFLDEPEFAEEVARRLPGGRLADLDDVAAAVVYLSSEMGKAVTGHILAVDRGWTAW